MIIVYIKIIAIKLDVFYLANRFIMKYNKLSKVLHTYTYHRCNFSSLCVSNDAKATLKEVTRRFKLPTASISEA